MKKVIFAFAIVLAGVFTSCGDTNVTNKKAQPIVVLFLLIVYTPYLPSTTAIATLTAVHTALFENQRITAVRARLTLYYSTILDILLERTLNTYLPRVDCF